VSPSEAEQEAFAPLLQQITAAFGGLSVPHESRLVLGCSLEAEQICRKFRGRHWCDLSMDDLEGEADSLGFFTPEAFMFFLPAFMKVAMVDPKRADIIPDSIVWRLAKCDCLEYWNERRAGIIEAARSMGLPDDLVQYVMNVEPREGPAFHPAWKLFTESQKDAVLAFVRFLKQWRGDEFTPGELDCVEQVLSQER
jgi:hypothetical protein